MPTIYILLSMILGFIALGSMFIYGPACVVPGAAGALLFMYGRRMQQQRRDDKRTQQIVDALGSEQKRK